MVKRIIKLYRRHLLRHAIKSLGPTAKILSYNASDNSFMIRYNVGQSCIKCKVCYDPTERKVVFDGKFYEHPDF